MRTFSYGAVEPDQVANGPTRQRSAVAAFGSGPIELDAVGSAAANLADFLQHFIHHSETAELNLGKVHATDPVSKLGLRIDCDRTGIRGPQTAHSFAFQVQCLHLGSTLPIARVPFWTISCW